jgi:hypothetical protein
MEDGDEITGLVAFNSFLYIIEPATRTSSRSATTRSLDGNVFAVVAPGCVNQRCIVVAGDECYMLDEWASTVQRGLQPSR